MPPSFPEAEFQAFGIAASNLFLPLMSEENLFDAQEKRRQFEWSWQAVRYRYRSCAECQEEFKALLDNASDMWRDGWGDEELTYKLERCIYMFFMGGLSVLDSFAFCLYFFGHAIQPGGFPDVATPRNITRRVTGKAFNAAFPQAKITELLAALQGDARFSTIDEVRNLVGHRIRGRRSVRASEETWHLPGTAGKLMFDEELLQRHLDDITGLLTSLASAAREFAENSQPQPLGAPLEFLTSSRSC